MGGWAPTPAGRIKAANREIERERKRPRRQQAHREIRCFWTWPLGHSYNPATGQCVGCGRHWDMY